MGSYAEHDLTFAFPAAGVTNPPTPPFRGRGGHRRVRRRGREPPTAMPVAVPSEKLLHRCSGESYALGPSGMGRGGGRHRPKAAV
jgi:hypothetical protein